MAESKAQAKKDDEASSGGTYKAAFPVDLTDPASGRGVHFEPGDVLPDWAGKIIRGDRSAEIQPVPQNDVPTPGPGQSFVYEDSTLDVGR